MLNVNKSHFLIKKIKKDFFMCEKDQKYTNLFLSICKRRV